MKNQRIDLNPQTAYLAGVVIGDGNLSSSVKWKSKDNSPDYRIWIEVSDECFSKNVFMLIRELTQTRSQPKQRSRKGRGEGIWLICERNKQLHKFLHKSMEIPTGKKSSSVVVPTAIKNSSVLVKQHFLAGYFDSDGGFRGNSIGFTTASIALQDGISDLLNEFNINHTKEEWTNKKYARKFYGIKIRKFKIDMFLKTFPLKNPEKFKRTSQKFHCGVAGVVKRAGFTANC